MPPLKDFVKINQFINNRLKKLITVKRTSTGNQSFLLACMPKSGSTWVQAVFSRLPRSISLQLVPNYGAREQEIDSKFVINYRLWKYRKFNTISQHHVKYNINTRNALLRHGIRPIVLTRDIRDNLVSLVDHWRIYRYEIGGADQSFSYYIEPDYFNKDMSSSIFSRFYSFRIRNCPSILLGYLIFI